MAKTLEQASLKFENIAYYVGTGYGRKNIPHVNHVESEIVCHARGALWNLPSVRTVIDIGAQDAKAIKIDHHGGVKRYIYNDKCAAGTGRFLEIMAEALEVQLENMTNLAQQSTKNLSLSNQCVVFAETEIISLVNEGEEIPDIIHALHKAMAHRIASLAKSIVVENDVVITGGVAKNEGVTVALEKALNVTVQKLPLDPQINGALGAALLAI